ncbi:MAG: glycosyltransferase [Patulibacter sp.]
MSLAPPTPRPTVCLTMIVRNEAHIIRESLDAAAGRIDRWVIVDTGSTDDTVAVIEQRMAEHGIPGEIHHRPWRDFGTNRSEALQLANGQADYLWVLDADDTVEGDLDLSGLTADSYLLRYRVGTAFWRRQIFRSGLPWRYEGVLHEYPVCDEPATEARLEGDYVVLGRTLGARSANPQKYRDDAELLRTVLADDPTDARSQFYLAQSLDNAGDEEGALEAYTRRAELGGWDEERCLALLRRADLLLRLGRPWSAALESLLEAFEARPTRAEPFARIARHYREQGKFRIAYEFARRAAEMPYPHDDNFFVDAGVYAWAARDEQAVCASYVGRTVEALDLGTELLASAVLPEDQRERVAANRDRCVAAVREERVTYPAATAARIGAALGGARPADAAPRDVTVVVRSTGDARALERTLNSLLHCVTDIDRAARFVCLCGAGGFVPGHAFQLRYPFVELLRTPADEDAATSINRLLDGVGTPYVLYVESGWELFARGSYVERPVRLLREDPSVAQVAFNRSYARSVGERHLVGGSPRDVDGYRYRMHHYVEPDTDAWRTYRDRMGPDARTNAHWPHFTLQPSLIEVERLWSVGPFAEDPDFERELAERYVAAGRRTAFFDEVSALPGGDPDAALPAEPPQPVALARLLPGARIGDLDLDLGDPDAIVGAGLTVDSTGLHLEIETRSDDGNDTDDVRRFRVTFGAGLRVRSVEPVTGSFAGGGPSTVPFRDGELVGESLGQGRHRFAYRVPGADDVASWAFTVAAAETEQLWALAWFEDELLAVFGLDRERLVVSLLGRDQVTELLLGVGLTV